MVEKERCPKRVSPAKSFSYRRRTNSGGKKREIRAERKQISLNLGGPMTIKKRKKKKKGKPNINAT